MAVRTYLKATLSILVFLVAMGWANAAGDTIHLNTADGPDASCLFPRDGQKFVSMTPILSWKAGINAQWHVIYFGTSFDDVNDAIVRPLVPPPLSYRGYQPVGDEDWDPIVDGGLTIEFETTYYWRIDEGQEELPPPIVGGTVIKGDVWCFTTVPHRIFVDIDADGANNGSNWADAYKHLQDALTEATSSDEIWVAEGTYKPDQGGGQTLGDRTATFQLINSVAIKGGYAGFGQPDPNARDIELYETILSGDLDGNDVEVKDPCDLLTEPTRLENSYHIVFSRWIDASAVLNGFTITGGNANRQDYPPLDGSGGGIYSDDYAPGSPTVANCSFIANSAFWAGGAMANSGSFDECSPILTNCTFSRNWAMWGGAIVNGGWYGTCNPTLTNCTFTGNAAGSGGGIDNNGAFCNITLTNCTFTGNSANFGGGVSNSLNNAEVTNCTFMGNSAQEGGGIYNRDNEADVRNCTFRSNGAQNGGGLFNEDSSSLTLVNCVFSGNSADSNGGGMSNSARSSPTLTNCIFTGNTANRGGGTFNDTGGNIILANCTLNGNKASYGGAIYCQNVPPEPPPPPPPSSISGAETSNETVMSYINADIYDDSKTLKTITNCIIWANEAQNGPQIYLGPNSIAWVSYSDVEGSEVDLYLDPVSLLNWEPGNIEVDPCFAKPGYWDPNGTTQDANDDFWVNGDYHLKSQAGRWDANEGRWTKDEVTSPCIDAGNPGCPVGDEPLPNGNRRNMGAFGGTAEASKSPTYWRSIADLTNDWVVDFNDLKVFVNYWLETGECIPSDLNRSKFVDFNDFAIFGRQWQEKGPGPGITYEVDKCIPWEPGSFVAEEPGQTRFSVRVEGNNIHFEDLITANCCADRIELQMTVDGNLITIYEIEHLVGVPCPCICDYPTTATLGPFEEGNYLVEVISINGGSLGFVEVTIGELVEPGITYQIEDCNRQASGLFAAIESSQTRFTVTVEGRNIHFEDMMHANCCPDKLEVQMTVEDNLITIYETEYTSGGCRCMCNFPITATLGSFEPGIYILEVYEDSRFIGSTTVTIEPGN